MHYNQQKSIIASRKKGLKGSLKEKVIENTVLYVFIVYWKRLTQVLVNIPVEG